MSNEYQFVNTNPEELMARLIAEYEKTSKYTMQPGSPERLLISWVASALTLIQVQINYAGNQNIPSRASGQNLDALGDLFFEKARPAAKPAVCTMRFTISEPQASAVLIPEATKVTDASGAKYWATTIDIYVPIGETYAEVQALCMNEGSEGNGYKAGQINKLVDVFPYFLKCENITESDGGSDTATDLEYYKQLKASEDAYSTAGPMGGYTYWAKTVSTDIADVVAIMPRNPDTDELMGGHVHIFALMFDGTIASETVKELILAACNEDSVRPLTDFVSTVDPDIVDYNIAFTYYVPANTPRTGAEIQQAVDDAVTEFKKWQSGKLGRDINPSYLISLLMKTGIKRVVLTEPAFTALNDGSDHLVPDVARCVSTDIVNGGYEDE